MRTACVVLRPTVSAVSLLNLVRAAAVLMGRPALMVARPGTPRPPPQWPSVAAAAAAASAAAILVVVRRGAVGGLHPLGDGGLVVAFVVELPLEVIGQNLERLAEHLMRDAIRERIIRETPQERRIIGLLGREGR